MRLRAYFDQEKITPAAFAAVLVARGYSVTEHGVRKWVSGERIPRREAMALITDVTGGMVSAIDFFASSEVVQ